MMKKTELRNVQGYDPAQDLSDVLYYNKEGVPGEPEKLLETKYRVLWFHHYLAEKGYEGVINDADIVYLPDAKLVVAKATVCINGEIVGKSCGGAFYTPLIAAQDPGIWQSVATCAKGRALGNAGFATANCFEGAASEVAGRIQASTIRDCDYDPAHDLIAIPQADGREEAYLNVNRRVLWFTRYLAAHKLSGYIDDSDVRFDPEAKMLIATARVVIDHNVVGQSSAARAYDPDAPAMFGMEAPILSACTAAKGRALANAGFGIVASGLEDGAEIPCEGGIKVTRDEMGTHVLHVYQKAVEGVNTPNRPNLPPREEPVEDTPTAPPKAAGKKKGEKPKPKEADEEAAPATEPPASEPEPVAGFEPMSDPEMPRDEALKFVVPIGIFKGQTLEAVLALPDGEAQLHTFATITNPKYADLRVAAKAVTAK